ncbi:EpsG family protein [Mesorhizobium sp. M0571]|uniref:EpsG family protein n=1 Tax=Mesorhizobium sp. M0571 TaxID=2956960 RepID=UPI00333C521A
MLPYWLMFGVPAFAALFERRGKALDHPGERWLFFIAGLAVCLLVGLRNDVGADWPAYLGHLVRASLTVFIDIPKLGDPGYALLNWISARVDPAVWLVNLVCAGLFSWGLFSFALAQPRPWLALAVAIPYLVIVVAMGYTRQGVAIGLAMRGLVALGRERSNLKFVVWVLIAATFHKSAVLLIPISALAESHGRVWTILWVGCAAILAYFALLQDSVDKLMYTYVAREYDSGGAAVRVIMNAIPAALFIFFRKRFLLSPREKQLWLILALIAIALVPALVISPSSTAVDRVGLYLIPIQIMVLSQIPESFGRSGRSYRFLGFLVVLYSAFVQYVWFNFGSHAIYWLPYQNYLVQG